MSEPQAKRPRIEETSQQSENAEESTGKVEASRDLYLDTINRHMLDFDFEKVCSVSLSHLNVYACLVCGKYYQGTYIPSLLSIHCQWLQGHSELICRQTIRTWQNIPCIFSQHQQRSPRVYKLAHAKSKRFMTYYKRRSRYTDVWKNRCIYFLMAMKYRILHWTISR